ncbi:MAG: hypothetical protein JNL08_03735 [Planctomycetes bacterium]|nr:hypothetical protein [Planctomycetota bacterium]
MRSIPPAPRRIRLRPLLAHRWPLLASGSLLVVCGTLLAWLMFLQEGGKWSDTARLDRGPCRIVAGTVLAVGPPFVDGNRALRWVDYEFPWARETVSLTLKGHAFVPEPAPAPGARVDVEVLVAEPNRNRIRGALAMIDHDYLHPPFWIAAMVAPGALLLLGWLAGAFTLRHVLVHGDVSVGRVVRVDRVPLVLPQMLRIDYEFRDHRAIVRRHGHWVRLHGALGVRLAAALDAAPTAEPLPVLHDRLHPQHSRMLLPQDFLPENTAAPTRLSEHGVT